jgi:hypothetical protein
MVNFSIQNALIIINSNNIEHLENHSPLIVYPSKNKKAMEMKINSWLVGLSVGLKVYTNVY